MIDFIGKTIFYFFVGVGMFVCAVGVVDLFGSLLEYIMDTIDAWKASRK